MIQKAIEYPALIKYLKGFSNYTWVHYCDGRKLLVAKSLCFFEDRLPGFFRVHKTALVNPHYITEFKAPPGHKMAGSIQLSDGEVLPVSRRRWNLLIDPMTVSLMKTSSTFQSHQTRSERSISILELAEKKGQQQASRQLWIVMADEVKGGLVRQLVGERWPLWRVRVFETGTRLQNALPGVGIDDMPGMIMLDGSDTKSMLTLKAIKSNVRFRFIPTLLLLTAGNHDLAEQSYLLGANSVIVHSADLTRFIQVLEKTFRYWLSMASAPRLSAERPLPLT